MGKGKREVRNEGKREGEINSNSVSSLTEMQLCKEHFGHTLNSLKMMAYFECVIDYPHV